MKMGRRGFFGTLAGLALGAKRMASGKPSIAPLEGYASQAGPYEPKMIGPFGVSQAMKPDGSLRLRMPAEPQGEVYCVSYSQSYVEVVRGHGVNKRRYVEVGIIGAGQEVHLPAGAERVMVVRGRSPRPYEPNLNWRAGRTQ